MRSSDTIGPTILKALGIKTKGARAAVITLRAGKPVTVGVEYSVEKGEISPADNAKISTIAAGFVLVEHELLVCPACHWTGQQEDCICVGHGIPDHNGELAGREPCCPKCQTYLSER